MNHDAFVEEHYSSCYWGNEPVVIVCHNNNGVVSHRWAPYWLLAVLNFARESYVMF